MGTQKTLAVLKRRYQEMFNSKLSSLMIILGPIAMIIVAGLALSDNSLQNVNAHIYTEEGGPFSDKLIEELSARGFNLQKTETLGDCRWPVFEGVSQACIEIKKRTVSSAALEESAAYGYAVNLHVDFSRQRTVWAVINVVREIVVVEENNIKDALATDLREKLDQTITDIDIALREIDTAITELNTLEGKILDDGVIKLQDVKRDIEGAQTVMDGVGSTIDILKESGASETFPNEMNDLESSYIGAYNRILQIKTDVQTAEDDLDEVYRKIGPAIKELEQTRQYLKNTKEQLGLIQDSDINELANPIPLTYSPVTREVKGDEIEEQLGFFDYLFPSFLMFFIMFAAIILSTSTTIKERKSPAFIRNMLSKAGGTSFVMGNFIATFSIVLLQTAIILLIGSRFLGIDLTSNIWPATAVLAIAISWFILIGSVIGYLVKSSEGANIAAVSLALVLLIFMPALTPTQSLPKTISSMVEILPSNILETQLRAITLFNVPFGLRGIETLSIGISSIILIIMLSLLYWKAKSKEI